MLVFKNARVVEVPHLASIVLKEEIARVDVSKWIYLDLVLINALAVNLRSCDS